jgi:nucleoside-diphosphate-sugar epimerase
VALIALTGGTGFIGQRLIPILIAQGHEVRALTRKVQDALIGVTWVEGDLDNKDALAQLCTSCESVIHMAGVIKGLNASDFERGNLTGTANILVAASNAQVSRFLHISSLAVRAPKLSHYSRSKAAAEDMVRNAALDWTILRPPGVYGPGDRETFALFKAARGPVLPIAAGRQRMSWIYVDDLCTAIVAALSPTLRHQMVEVDDGAGGYTQRQFAIAIAKSVGGSPVIIAIPQFIVAVAGAINQVISTYTGNVAMLTPGKVREIFHHDWIVGDCSLAKLTSWRPNMTLATGLTLTSSWYKTQKWF